MDTMTFLYDPKVIEEMYEKSMRKKGREEQRAFTEKERKRALREKT